MAAMRDKYLSAIDRAVRPPDFIASCTSAMAFIQFE